MKKRFFIIGGLFTLFSSIALFFFFVDLRICLALIKAPLATLQQHHLTLLEFVTFSPAYALSCYNIFFIINTACALPVTLILTLLGGYLFGAPLATLAASFGSTIGSVIAFLATRYLFGNRFQRRYAAELTTFNQRLVRHGMSYLFAIRLIPVIPFFLVTILSGLTQIPIRTFVIATFFGTLPSLYLYSTLGKQFTAIKSTSDLFTLPVLALMCLIALTALIPLILSLRK